MNTQVNITENGTTTLATAGKYCDRNIDVNVNVAVGDNHYDAFWDAFQQNGNRTLYNYGFAGEGWNDKTFKPKYDIICKYGANSMFHNSRITDLKAILESCGVVLDLSAATTMGNMFTSCSGLTTIPKIDASSATTTGSMCASCMSLKTIEELVVSENTAFSSTFANCIALENMIVTGTIAKNGFDVHYSTKLTHESLMSIINCLADKTAETGTTWKVTIGAENVAKLTEAEVKIATDKGWVIE